MPLASALTALGKGQDLDEHAMADAVRRIMDGNESGEDIASFLTLLSQKGETAAEITGAARVMREKAATIDAPPGAVDCCGTGGDGLGTYNISTAAALVAAACGVPVAKHGNRASSSKSGAADVLEAMGVNLETPPARLQEALRTLNFAFLMAPRHHAAMRHVMPVRKALGFRTVFNLLGPLANPAGAQIQLVGVYDKKWLRPMAETLFRLGAHSAWVVHGSDGLDEITLTGPTHAAFLKDGIVTESVVTPEDFGLPRQFSPEEIRGGDARANAAALSSLLSGAPSSYRNVVLANAAAVLILAGKAATPARGVSIAAAAIDSGEATSVLERYISFTKAA